MSTVARPTRRAWHPFAGMAAVAAFVAATAAGGVLVGALSSGSVLVLALLASGMGMTSGYAASGST